MGDGNGKTCIICLEEHREMGKVVTTNSCCKQTAHVACLQGYYHLLATCQNLRKSSKNKPTDGYSKLFRLPQNVSEHYSLRHCRAVGDLTRSGNERAAVDKRSEQGPGPLGEDVPFIG